MVYGVHTAVFFPSDLKVDLAVHEAAVSEYESNRSRKNLSFKLSLNLSLFFCKYSKLKQ